ncbi:MAG TPA: FkbM family methyltransferase [Solirubrobacterales bacterium]
MNSSPGRRVAGKVAWTGLRALNRTGRLSRSGAVVELRLHGRAVAVPLWGGIGLDHGGIPDEHLIGVMRSLLGLRGGAFVDVGAHVGQTLVKLLVLGDPRPYLGIEPKLRAAAYVEALLAANGRVGDSVIAAAAGEAAGIALLEVAGDLDDSASLLEPGAAGRAGPGVRPVPVVRGDDALATAGIGELGLLKIDAEGAELEVVRGFEGAIARDRPPIMCEILPFDSEPRRRRAAELTELLAGLGYAMLLCDSSGRARRVDAAAADRGFDERDYVFVPADEVDRLPGLVVGI